MTALENKRIVLAVCGSIAAVETVRLAHELRRRGARVTAILSPAACGIVNPDALTYACATPALTTISGMVEHVQYCGEGGEADLLLIAPATANTISKIACGIDDTIVTTFATTAIGRGMPVVLAPAMHESMYRHAVVARNISALAGLGIVVVPPRMEEDKAKIAGIEEICLYAERALSPQPLAGRKVLITSGACREPVDSVRIMTTRSSGRMGREMALAAFRRGADVTVVSNTDVHGIVPCVRNIRISSAADMADAVMAEADFADYYVSAAAISDFAPEAAAGKIPSGTSVTLSLRPHDKLMPKLFGRGIRIIGFKIGEDAEEAGRRLLNSADDVVMVAANYPATMGAADGEYLLLRKEHETIAVSGAKDVIAGAVWDAVL